MKINKIYLLALVVLMPARLLSATMDGEQKMWHKISITFDGPDSGETASPNPFMDYRLDVTFTNGEVAYVVPGYYAADGNAGETSATSGNKWRVHFSPDRTGVWNWSASFRTGNNVAVSDDPGAGSGAGYFDGESGRFEVSPTDKTGRDFRSKGRLEYVGKTHLQFKGTGEYFFKQGSDSPENLFAYEDFDGNFQSDGEKDHLVKSWSPHAKDWNLGDPQWQDGKGTEIIGVLNYLASEGLNGISFLTMNILGDDRNVFPYTDYNERVRMDISKLAQWEIVMSHAGKLGLFMDIKLSEHENDHLLDNGDMGTERILYYREMVARFGHHLGLQWNLGEENGISVINNNPHHALFQTTAQRVAMTQWFHTNDPYENLITIHNGKLPDDLLGDESKLTGFSYQSHKLDFSEIHGKVLEYINKSANAGTPWVIFNDEPGDGHYGLSADPEYNTVTSPNNYTDARKNAMWGVLMAGGAGSSWYFGYKNPPSDLNAEDLRSRDLWWDYCRYALQFMNDNSIPFQDMQNDNSLVSGANWCLKKDGDTYVVYLPNGGSSSLNLAGESGKYQVKWYDPRNGGSLQNGSKISIEGGGRLSIGTPPSNSSEDWVALIAIE